MPCAYAPFAPASTAFKPACDRPSCLSPPPTAFLKAYVLLSRLFVSDARTDRREATTSLLGELGSLGTGGDAIHPRRARNLRSTALVPASLASLRRVHFAYAVSITVPFREDVLRAVGLGLGGPSEPGNENNLHVLLLPDNLHFYTVFVAAQATAECTRARTFGKAKACTVAIRYVAVSLRPPPHTLYIALPYRQALGSTAPRPFINDTVRTRGGLISGRHELPTAGTRVPPC
ncbi:hypothetical protein B0H14DRAFT_3469038 [Mycena olivaceomarginata]|nr:hypothetical protein B0H14DRAFT_3469038 [Mycena olivaceomarginata]